MKEKGRSTMRGKDVRKIREELGLSQERLAALMGVNQSTVSRLEARGGPLRARDADQLNTIVRAHRGIA